MSSALVVTLDWLGDCQRVGVLQVVTRQGGSERYPLSDDRAWCRTDVGLDPELDLIPEPPVRAPNSGAPFRLSPDRWGWLVQDRVQDRQLSESDDLLGVSDRMRIGA